MPDGIFGVGNLLVKSTSWETHSGHTQVQHPLLKWNENAVTGGRIRFEVTSSVEYILAFSTKFPTSKGHFFFLLPKIYYPSPLIKDSAALNLSALESLFELQSEQTAGSGT